ncbi:phist protein (Pf-fam-b) [Plasmodium vivax North Korean]|uniref:Phist protein (Pf-fam-b) n=1 Tax=Plasmodium vivax North Korean TaxID=1035514 RepID=A0A0J9U0F5_PLAVI|nr:phist protein (Pf-fam-b) [Plasmodium vivax North Korean]
MAFPAFKSVLSVALLYVLYQGNNEYDVHTISEWKNSKRSRNLAEFFPQKTGISGENYGNNEHAQYGNAGLQITNYNKSRVSNVMDLFQDVDITGSSWDNYCSQNEKFDSQYWENHEDPFEQASTSVPEAYEIPEEDSSIKTAPTSIKKNKKKSKVSITQRCAK